jgi:hypothetical protein
MSNESYASGSETATTTSASDAPGMKNASPSTNPRTER